MPSPVYDTNITVIYVEDYNYITSFHEDMQAEVRIGGAESFRVRNGLRQGSTPAPTLFNLFFGAVVSTWRTDCIEVGVNVLSRPAGRKLIGD